MYYAIIKEFWIFWITRCIVLCYVLKEMSVTKQIMFCFPTHFFLVVCKFYNIYLKLKDIYLLKHTTVEKFG